tara:strand:- start:39319 stop:40572 length:1254 start_codon:yes stop_codon:yes gene_type:complete
MGTGVMIGAGIFALTGQVAELAGRWFPLAFVLAGIIAGFSAYSYVKMAAAYPSAGGIAMFLGKAYGKGTVTAVCALMMYVSMVINESLVARTFGTYTLQLFDAEPSSWAVPALGVGLLLFAFMVNLMSTSAIQALSYLTAFVKAAGLLVLAAGGLWAAGFDFGNLTESGEAGNTDAASFLGAVALGILAYKGFTTITNSGDEIEEPHKNVGRAIILSLLICGALYLLITLAVGSSLTVEEIIKARDYALAEASRPAYGQYGLWVTVGFAIVATVSGVIASVFAVSRMLAMLTDMKLVPHRHFGMPGDVQTHTLVYTIVLAMALTIVFDLSRIASLGAIFYILMDMAIHWGVLTRLRDEVDASAAVLMTALLLDAVVLAAFIWVKAANDSLVIWASVIGLAAIIVGERWFLVWAGDDD